MFVRALEGAKLAEKGLENNQFYQAVRKLPHCDGPSLLKPLVLCLIRRKLVPKFYPKGDRYQEKELARLLIQADEDPTTLDSFRNFLSSLLHLDSMNEVIASFFREAALILVRFQLFIRFIAFLDGIYRNPPLLFELPFDVHITDYLVVQITIDPCSKFGLKLKNLVLLRDRIFVFQIYPLMDHNDVRELVDLLEQPLSLRMKVIQEISSSVQIRCFALGISPATEAAFLGEENKERGCINQSLLPMFSLLKGTSCVPKGGAKSDQIVNKV